MYSTLTPKAEIPGPEQAYLHLAAAFARGKLGLDPGISDGDAYLAAIDRGLRLHRFKKTIELPRVASVMGMLRSLSPSSLLDIGSGRGTFLWPLIDSFPWLSVTSLEADSEKQAQLAAVSQGGVSTLTSVCGDARANGYADASFDIVTILEVLEHLPDPERAAAECIRSAQRYVLASVPSKPDDNPEHIQLFSEKTLSDMMLSAGAAKVKITHVHNHMICLAAVS